MADFLARIVVALCVLLVAASTGPTALAATGASIAVDAPSTLDDGETVTATLRASNVTDPDGVGSYDVNVTYDPSVVSIDAADAGGFDVEASTPEAGVLRLVGYTGSLPGPTGDVDLAALEITGLAAGSATIDVTVESVTDARANDLPHAAGSASVTVGSTPGSTPTPSGASPGDTTDSDGTDEGPSTDGAVLSSQSRALVDVDQETAGTTVRFDAVSVSEIRFDDDLAGGQIRVSDLSTLPDDALSAPGGEHVVHAVEITVPSTARNRSATIRLSLPRDSLGGVDPVDARLARYADGSWHLLETAVVAADSASVSLEAKTPGFSVFGVVARQSTPTPDRTATPTTTPGTTPTATSTPTPVEPTTDDGTPAADVVTTVGSTQTDTATSTGGSPPASPAEPSGFESWMIVVALVLLAAAAVLGYRHTQRRDA